MSGKLQGWKSIEALYNLLNGGIGTIGRFVLKSGSDASELQITNGAAKFIMVDENGNYVVLPILHEILQNAAITNGNGTSLDVAGYEEALITITPNSSVTAATVTFMVGDVDGNYINPQFCIRETDYATAGNTVTAINSNVEIWRVNVKNYKYLRTVLSNLTGTGATMTVTAEVE